MEGCNELSCRLSRRATVTLLGMLFLVSAGLSHAAPIVLDFVVDAKKYGINGFPKSCFSYMALYHPDKPRPLFMYGWGIDGTITMTFDNESGMKETFEKKIVGGGTVGFNGYSCTVLQDWRSFACAPWLLLRPRPIIYVVVRNLRELNVSDTELGKFFKDDLLDIFDESATRGPALTKNGESLVSPRVSLVADVEVKASGRTALVREVPVKMSMSGSGHRWRLSFSSQFTFQGKDLGFPGEHAGEIEAYIGSAAFCLIPERFKKKKPTAKDQLEASLDDIDADLGLGN